MSRPDSIELPSQYAPAEVEGPRYQSWEKAGYFAADAQSDAPAFSIVIPPPNVTGSLHIGHALDHTLMDALVRRRRMQGYNALWLPGMDHAGIATQNVVERELAKEGLSRHDLGREAFVERVWQWKASSGGKIGGQMRRLGDSVDWSRERFTMDEGLSRAVQTIFKRLFDDGLIYRAERIINWCPRCLTALSDIEVEHSDDEGELVSIRYGDGPDSIVVATTRAETMLGDTAVAVHPDDERYTHLVGRTVELPLTGRRIPVVADDHVDPAFGTGAVKVHGAGPFPGLGRVGGPGGGGRGTALSGPVGGLQTPVRALGRALQPLRHHGRAAPVAPVVRPRRPAGRRGGRRGARRPGPPAPAGDERAVLRLGG
ncbi:MAG: class I tRNA ligase family protein [Streptosporangiaceae bacterium]